MPLWNSPGCRLLSLKNAPWEKFTFWAQRVCLSLYCNLCVTICSFKKQQFVPIEWCTLITAAQRLSRFLFLVSSARWRCPPLSSSTPPMSSTSYLASPSRPWSSWSNSSPAFWTVLHRSRSLHLPLLSSSFVYAFSSAQPLPSLSCIVPL